MDNRTENAAPTLLEGGLVVPSGARFALVVSRFNHFIVDRLVEGALDAIARHGGDLSRVLLIRVPGAWETPPIVARLAHKKSVDAIIALGAVIRGSTPTSTTWPGRSRRASPRSPCRRACPSPSAFSPRTPSSRRSSAPAPRAATRLGGRGERDRDGLARRNARQGRPLGLNPRRRGPRRRGLALRALETNGRE